MKKIKKIFALVIISTILAFGFIITLTVTHNLWFCVGIGVCFLGQFFFTRRYMKLVNKNVTI